MRYLSALLLATIGLGACDDDPGIVEPAPDGPVAATVDASAGPIFRTLSVTLGSTASAHVEYWAEGSPRLRVTSSAESTEHSLFLPRLRANSSYSYEVRSVSSGGASEPLAGAFQTDSLPDEVSVIGFTAAGTPTSPLTLLEVRAPFWSQVIVDGEGEVVWYRPGRRIAQGVTRLANGDYAYNERSRIRVETPDHQVVAELERRSGMGLLHHEVITTPDNTLLFLSQGTSFIEGADWTGEVIWEWDPETDELSRRWNAADFLSPSVDNGPRTSNDDWLHANSLGVGPRGNVLISLYWLHEVMSIAPDYESIEWRLGGPQSSFSVADGAMDAGQHTANELSPGRVLLFDNGLDRPDSLFFSRASELELDHDAGTARIAWEFRPQPDIYTPVMSSARRLANGNTVILFGNEVGFVGSSGPIVLYEVNASGEAIWSMGIEGLVGVYRATPLNDVGGEEVVSQP